MPGQGQEAVVGLDNGGRAINATVLDSAGRFLVDRLVETPSRVAEGPGVAIEALAGSFAQVLGLTGVAHESVRAVGRNRGFRNERTFRSRTCDWEAAACVRPRRFTSGW